MGRIVNYSRVLKHALKVAAILLGAVVAELFLSSPVILQLCPWIRELSPAGPSIALIVLTIGVPIVVVAAIGVVGGLWLRGHPINGLVLSLGFYLWWFGCTAASYPWRVDLVTFTLLLGLVVLPAFGTGIYALVASCMPAKRPGCAPPLGT